MTHARTQVARQVTVGITVLVATALGGCATHASRVDCDGRLEPINAPVPLALTARGSSAGAAPSAAPADHEGDASGAQKDQKP